MIFRKLLLYCALAGTIPAALQAQNQPSFDPAYQFVQSGNLVQDKNFYLLTLLEQEPTLHKALEHNKILQQIYKQQLKEVDKITDSCKNAACFATPLLFDSNEIKAIGNALEQVYKAQPAFRATLQQHLKPSGAFMRYESLPDVKILEERWREEANGLNYILTAYTRNTGLRYPRIDSAMYNVHSDTYTRAVRDILVTYKQHPEASGLFFTPTLHLAMDLLQLNKKDHAARHEPMALTNQKTLAQLSSVQWDKFDYSAILVLGAGPDDDAPISVMNKLRCRTAADIYQKNKAPFVIVSGGYVHPFGTKYSEAIEMKRFLADSCNVPETAILVDPHARHTTTNLRNANRILFRNGFPTDKKILCTSSKAHLIYVASVFFEKVCLKDMGYLPYRKLRQVDDLSIEYYPVAESLHEDPLDPLDP
ncbi:Uncharacterized SAM-binding protein YcdF, DUF218 family [Chitinophaga rupis]|uniref:Uncharacterized SAM-binding protein YcdF, DUF218 family n=1 Tax=Chitinophaga rupis TaxID=573321 RepID=A0A1H8FCS2_9BACT|nr:YdcF family protein [Chitinophaga rupis]SEN28798.1 Uncharacterized SAM-binding protein YcdF, DUF218 family [Chitinophaga rupis]